MTLSQMTEIRKAKKKNGLDWSVVVVNGDCDCSSTATNVSSAQPRSTTDVDGVAETLSGSVPLIKNVISLRESLIIPSDSQCNCTRRSRGQPQRRLWSLWPPLSNGHHFHILQCLIDVSSRFISLGRVNVRFLPYGLWPYGTLRLDHIASHKI